MEIQWVLSALLIHLFNKYLHSIECMLGSCESCDLVLVPDTISFHTHYKKTLQFWKIIRVPLTIAGENGRKFFYYSSEAIKHGLV